MTKHNPVLVSCLILRLAYSTQL